MTEAEFLQVMQEIESYWREEPVSPDEMAVYAKLLRREAHVAVLAAVQALAVGGQARMPTAGQIARKLVELKLDPPPWGDVMRILIRAIQKGGPYISIPEGKGYEDRVEHDDRKDFVARQHSLIQSFVAMIGWSYLAEWSSADRTAEAQLRQKWEAHVANAVESGVLAGIEGSGLARIERAQREVESGAAGLPMPVLKEIGP